MRGAQQGSRLHFGAFYLVVVGVAAIYHNSALVISGESGVIDMYLTDLIFMHESNVPCHLMGFEK